MTTSLITRFESPGCILERKKNCYLAVDKHAGHIYTVPFDEGERWIEDQLTGSKQEDL